MLVKHIVSQYATEPEIANLAGCILRTKTTDLYAWELTIKGIGGYTVYHLPI